MTFGIRGPWSTTTPGSDSKLNGMMIIEGAGDDLTGLDKTVYKHIYCTADETGGGLLAGHRYHASVDELSWVDETGVIDHTHTGTDDGGAFLDIMRSNPKFLDINEYFIVNLTKSKYVEAHTSTGSATDDTDGTTGEESIILATGATSGSRAQITAKSMNIDFSERSFFQTKVKVGTLSDLNFRTGVRIDQVTSTDSDNEQYAAEICTATNNNWFCRSASGTGHSTSDTTIAATTNNVALKLEHYPDLGTPEVDLYIDANAAFQKTSDVAITGASAIRNIFRHSLKNSSANDRTVKVFGSRIAYLVSDNWI